MRLVAAMDAGPVYTQEKITLSGNESKLELANKLLGLGSRLLVDNLPSILSGALSPTPQDDSKATYTHLLNKDDGNVDWQKPAELIEHEVRAFTGFPKSKAKILDRDVIITKSRVAKNKDDGDLVIECQPGWLEVREIIAPSGRSVTGAEFIRGYSKN
jgi:methionyl-tRNA formyltransferase